MTDKQPEALRLADAFGIPHWTGLPIALHVEAAAELRRLHEVNAELVEALKKISESSDDCWQRYLANTALAKATGDNND